MAIAKLTSSYTLTEDRIAQVKQVVPEAFADGRINWEALREILGENLEDEDQAGERFGLFWPGKRSARRAAATPPQGALWPAPGEGVNEESTRHVFIEGENLEVLKLLRRAYAGRVKMIYIDPPYNTGNDFIYSDDYAEPVGAYLSRTGQAGEKGELLTSNAKTGGRYHSNWLNMMYPRLVLARELLREDGVIFVSIDDNEVQNLRALMSEIFGEECFVASIIWQKVFSPKNTAKYFSEDHDYIVLYARSIEQWMPNLLPRSEEADARYSNNDNDPRGPWSSSDLTARNYYSQGQYTVTGPTGRQFGPGMGRYWRSSYERFRELDRDARVWWGADGNGMPRLKRFLSDVRQGIIPQTLWRYENVGHTQEAKKELLEHVQFVSTENVLNTVKPTRLLQRMLQIATEPSAGDIVVDFFAGSSTTAHAVFRQNREDNGNRAFVSVQLPEPLPIQEKTLSTIADIGKERIRRVIAKVQQEHAGKLDLQEREQPEDLGFRVYKLGRSQLKRWQPREGESVQGVQAHFAQFESPLVEEWDPEALRVEVVLQEGFPLDSKVERLTEVKRNGVDRVGSDWCEHRLFVCLDAALAEETVERLPGLMGAQDILVCLDSALTDESKMRLDDRCNVHVI